MKKLSLLLLALGSPMVALAHVGYVVSSEEFASHSGTDTPFLLSVFSQPSNIILMVVTALVLVLLVYILPKISIFSRWFARIEERMDSYGEFIPWMIRLSLGIALIGAAGAHVLVSPISVTNSTIALFELILGFAWLAGFLLVPTAFATIGLYLTALVGKAYMIGNLDFLALAVAFLALYNARPGIDDIFGIGLLDKLRLPREIAPLVLRLGIGIGMAYLALYEKLLNPHLSELVVSEFHLTSVIPVSPQMWVFSAGMIELAVALFLLFGLYTRLASLIAFAVLVLTFFFFQEAVFSHVTLFGTLSILFVLGAGKWSLDAYLRKKPAPLSPETA